MGYIDQTTYTLSCECSATESQTIREHGSQYGASWGAGKEFDQFVVTWEAQGDFEPKIVNATCKSCGATPTLTTR